MRSAMFHASPRSCVTTRIATSVSCTRLEHQLQDLAAHRGVEARDRLVGDDQPRVERHRARDHDALALAAGDLVRVEREEPLRRPQPGARRARRPRAPSRRRAPCGCAALRRPTRRSSGAGSAPRSGPGRPSARCAGSGAATRCRSGSGVAAEPDLALRRPLETRGSCGRASSCRSRTRRRARRSRPRGRRGRRRRRRGRRLPLRALEADVEVAQPRGAAPLTRVALRVEHVDARRAPARPGRPQLELAVRALVASPPRSADGTEQPVGSARGSGGSPPSPGGACGSARSPMVGNAAASAFVYGCAGAREDLVARALLDDPARVHDREPLGRRRRAPRGRG